MPAYHLVSYDDDGTERPDQDGGGGAAVLDAARTTPPTDVFLMSHGWQGDVPSAHAQYDRWTATMAGCPAEVDRFRAAGGTRPLVVGLHWPSRAWGDEDVSSDEQLVEAYAERLGDPAQVRDDVRTLVESARSDPAPRHLPVPVRDAYRRLDAVVDGPADAAVTSAEDRREPFDPERTYQAALREQAVSFGPLGGLGSFSDAVLAPLRTLTFWRMKRRARHVGETGAAALLDGLRAAAPDTRVHLMGHSFGCIVMSAALAGPAGGPARRPVDTLVLVQGAMSLWSFCAAIPSAPDRGGAFRRVVADRLVTGPTVVTTSIHDRAVGTFYPLAAGVGGEVEFEVPEVALPVYGGIGTWGVQGPGVDVDHRVLDPAQDVGDLTAGTVHNIDASAVIATGGGVSGAHSDICHPELARVVYRAMGTSMPAPVRP